ncbi:AP-1-like transcription factor 4 [Colletotrichum chlorophyti]|uniref:AP-1-like transcription factor 4 n=1 Tax=Colletotrichum chlorophyti TaxID=708187 RepID=A0A1Q8RPT9_9PEZI|nr:AP-1-like transcription factor 4 [Colletotrichum chlorophyti]
MSSGIPPMGTGNTPYDLIAAQFASRIGSNENGYCTPSSLWSGPPSPTSSIDTSKAGDSTDESGQSSASPSEESISTAQKSRRANRYKNCSESVLSKRRAQNRANQRAYRKRKEQRLEELQLQLDDMSQKNDALCCAYRLLAEECCRLRASQLSGQSSAWNLNGGGLALDMAAVSGYSLGTMSTSSPVPESFLDYPETPDKQLWSPYSA